MESSSDFQQFSKIKKKKMKEINHKPLDYAPDPTLNTAHEQHSVLGRSFINSNSYHIQPLWTRSNIMCTPKP